MVCETWCVLFAGHDQECQDMADIWWFNDGKHHPTDEEN